MERFTFEVNGAYYVKDPRHLYDDTWELVQKLGRIENLEEELGIDLITLFKTLKDNIYYNDCGKIIKVVVLGVSPMRENKFALDCYYDFKKFRVDTRDYGKTFALTKEELENE